MATTIVTKNSSTASAVPTAAQLVQGELAVNVADKRIFTENNAGAIVELGTNPSAEIVANGGIALPDNGKATFGASDDLQIYHDGSNSYVQDAGTGDLIVRANNLALQATSGEQYAAFVANGSASLFYDNAQKLATTATGIDVTGTATMDGLVVDGEGRIEETGAAARFVVSRTDALNTAATASVDLLEGSAGGSFGSANNYGFSIDLDGSANTLNILSGNQTTVTKRLSVARDTGDISFYEDTGTTAKLFWDASAESLGIGTSSPSTALDMLGDLTVRRAAASTQYTQIQSGGGESSIIAKNGFGSTYQALKFLSGNNTTTAERMRIDSSGNVGIGTSSPSEKVQINNGRLRFLESGQRQYNIGIASGTPDFQIYDATFSYAPFTLDGSGNVGIGISSPAYKLETKDGDIATVKLTAAAGGNAVNGMRFRVNNSANTAESATLGMINAETVNSWGGVLTFSTKPANGTPNETVTERMRIDSSGNVGIGVVPSASSATTNIELPYGATLSSRSNTTAPQFAMMSNAVGNWYEPTYKINGYATQYVQQGNDGTHAWSTAASGTAGNAISFAERMRIDSSGNLLVGTTAVQAKLTVAENQASSFVGHFTNSNGNAYGLGIDTGSGSQIFFYLNNSNKGSIISNSSGTAYNTTSDQRLKENIADADDAGSKIDAIQVRKFDWKADGSHQDYGMVAQELQLVAPEAVSGDANSEEMMGVDYSKLVPMLIKEIQSLRNRVAQLEA